MHPPPTRGPALSTLHRRGPSHAPREHHDVHRGPAGAHGVRGRRRDRRPPRAPVPGDDMNAATSLLGSIAVPLLLTLAWGYWFVLRAHRSAGWPRVAATITASRVVQQGNARSPRVAFEYLAAARRQVGDRLWVAPRTIAVTGGWADRVALRYPPGAQVLVAVDPADPAYAVLEPGVKL